MALSRDKIKKVISSGLKATGDLSFIGKITRKGSSSLDVEGNVIPGSIMEYQVKVIEDGISDGKDINTITNPSDKVIYVFNAGIDILNTDIIAYDGNEYIIALASDESVGCKSLHRLIVRKRQ